jgi:hypothetical protein
MRVREAALELKVGIDGRRKDEDLSRQGNWKLHFCTFLPF